MARLILLEDEPFLLDELSGYLRTQGHQVSVADSLATFRQRWAEAPHDLAIVDLGLPDGEGLDLVAELRRGHKEIGIIILTARAQSLSRIQGFDTGADHYLAKPVRLAELQAVVNALARRVAPWALPEVWVLNPVRLELLGPSGLAVPLSQQDCRLLCLLVSSVGRTVSRRRIITGLGEDYLTYDQRRLDSQLRRLRQKVRRHTGRELPVTTVHSVGYVFAGIARLQEG